MTEWTAGPSGMTAAAARGLPLRGRQHRPTRRLPLDDLRSAVMAPVISPLPTVMALIGRALSAPGRADEPPYIRRTLRAHLRERDIAALLPLRHAEALDGSAAARTRSRCCPAAAR